MPKLLTCIKNYMLTCLFLAFNALDSKLTGLGFCSGKDQCVVFLGKSQLSHSASSRHGSFIIFFSTKRSNVRINNMKNKTISVN